MSLHRPRAAALLVAAALAACQAAPLQPPTGGGGRSPRPAGSLAPSAGPTGAGEPSSGLATPPTDLAGAVPPAGLSPGPAGSLAPTVSPAALTASLVGLVRAPVLSNNGGNLTRLLSDKGLGVVSNNGAGVVSNNGSNVVSNNGGGYRLAALPAEAPLAGARVRLLDAAGQPVLGSDGKPFEADTDAAGRYVFRGTPAGKAFLLAVALPDAAGELAAIAPADAPAGSGPDLDLVSTLATGYVVNGFVRPQADPGAALARLTAAAEAATREKTRTALTAAAAPPPPRLTRDAVVATVAALREADAPLSRQLTDVRCLIVAAGACELPEGQPATSVPVSVAGLVRDPDGALYFNDVSRGVVWRLDPDGKLRSAYRNDPADGLLVARALSRDAAGRVLLVDVGGPPAAPVRAWRREADGRLVKLWSGTAEPKALFGGDGDDVLVLTREGLALSVAPGRAPETVYTAASADKPAIARAAPLGGIDAAGRIYLATTDGGKPVAMRLDGTTRKLEPVAGGAGDALTAIEIDPAGNVFVALASGKLEVRTPDGRVLPIADQAPAGVRLGSGRGALLAPDGAVYLGAVGKLLRLEAGVMSVVAGNGAPDFKPLGLAAGAEGTLYVGEGPNVDDNVFRFLTLRPGEPPVVRAGVGAPAPHDQPLLNPIMRVRLGPGDVPYLLDLPESGSRRILRWEATQALSPLYTPPAGAQVADFAPEPGGTLLVAEDQTSGQAYTGTRMVRLDAAGGRTQLLAPTRLGGGLAIARAPGGEIYLAGSGQLWRWREGQAPQALAASPLLTATNDIVVAPDGKVYVTAVPALLLRWEPGATEVTSLRLPEPTRPALLGTAAGLAIAPDGALLTAMVFAGQVLRLAPADR